MSEISEFTGERFMPECERDIWYEHWHRYVFAGALLADRKVLDVACGEGYGSHLLAGHANAVVGVDIDVTSVHHAAARYRARDNLHYVPASCHALPFRDGAFDGVVSFETIEHVPEQEHMVAELRRVLASDGCLILSSPNRKIYSDDRNYRNPFHVRELYLEELVALLGRHFGAVRLFSQKLLFHSAIWRSGAAPGTVSTVCANSGGEIAREALPYEAMYFIALCAVSEEHLPDTEGLLSLFADDSESVARHYENSVSDAIRLNGLVRERERIIAERDATLEQRTQQMREREQIIAERDATLEQRTQQMREREQIIAERDATLELRTRQMVERDAALARSNVQIESQQAELLAAGERAEKLNRSLAESRVRREQLQASLLQRERDLAYRDSWRWWVRRPFRPFKRWWSVLREGGQS